MMKNKIYSILAAAALLSGLCACDDNWNPAVEKEGKVSMASLSLDINGVDVVTGRASYDTSNFIVDILKGEDVVSSWAYKNIPELMTLAVGDYTVRVRSHEVQKQEWNAPYFLGSKDFSVSNNAITEVGTIVCSFSNIKVDIVFEADLIEHMSSDSKVSVVANDEGSLVFTASETRSGYFEATTGSMTLVSTFTGTIDGSETEIRNSYTNVAPGSHYKITYSLKSTNTEIDETGWVSPGSAVSVMTSVIDVNMPGNVEIEDDLLDDSDRPGQEEPEDPVVPDDPVDPPTEADITFTSTMSFTEPNVVVNGMSGAMDIHSADGFQNFNVTIASDNDNFISAVKEMLPQSFDLVHPGDNADAFASLGFPVGDDFTGKTDITFDITSFLPLLAAFPGNHEFAMQVVDNNGATKNVTLKLTVN